MTATTTFRTACNNPPTVRGLLRAGELLAGFAARKPLQLGCVGRDDSRLGLERGRLSGRSCNGWGAGEARLGLLPLIGKQVTDVVVLGNGTQGVESDQLVVRAPARKWFGTPR